MALPAVNGNTIAASDLYQLCQPAGNTEKGTYYLDGWGNAATDEIGAWCPSQSRAATPVSVSLDTSVAAANGVAAPSTNSLSQYGFHAFTTMTGAAVKGFVAGIFTIQF